MKKIIFLVLMVVLGAICFVFWKYHFVEITSDFWKTRNMSTYNDPVYGISFKYPKDWYIDVRNNPGKDMGYSEEDLKKLSHSISQKDIYITDASLKTPMVKQLNCRLVISLIDNTDNLKFQDWKKLGAMELSNFGSKLGLNPDMLYSDSDWTPIIFKLSTAYVNKDKSIYYLIHDKLIVGIDRTVAPKECEANFKLIIKSVSFD